jgi:hypothetical protein
MGSRFAYNCYRHSSHLILRRRGQDCYTIHSQEGVTQGDPLSMVLYGLALAPLSESLRIAVPGLVQPWYADDAAMAGPISQIRKAQLLLQEWGPQRGYYPEPSKSVLVTPPFTTPDQLTPLTEFNYQVTEGSRYIGGFVGSASTQTTWLNSKIDTWLSAINKLASVAKRFPQSALAGLVKSLQGEWQYLQRVTPNVGDAFAPLEQALSTTFLPALFDATPTEIANIRPLLSLPVRMGGLGIPDPTKLGPTNHTTSNTGTSLLQSSLLANTPLSSTAHEIQIAEARRDSIKLRETTFQQQLASILTSSSPVDKRRITRSAKTGSWLSSIPSSINGTDLSAEEFRDNIRLRFGLQPKALPPYCDGCGSPFTPEHAMSCRIGGLVLQRHNHIAAEWGHLCSQASLKISDEPLIHTSRETRTAGTTNTPTPPELRGDIAAHGFWRNGTQTIFDVRVTDTDAHSQRNTPPERVLLRHEKDKKNKYSVACQERRKHFTPLVFSVDGLFGVEAKAATQRLASLLAEKWHRPYSTVCGFLHARLGIALARSASQCLRADRNPIPRPRPIPWESGSGLHLFQ